MKQKIILVSAAMLVAGTVMAERTKPVLTPMDAPVDSTLEAAHAFYLYNVQKVGFALGANDWNTRLSVGSTGDSLKVVKFTEGVGFYDYGKNKDYWSPDSWDGIWNDGSRTGYDQWTLHLKDTVNKVYTLSNTKLGEGTLGSLSTDSTATPRLYVYKADTLTTATFNDEWQFLTKEDYQTVVNYIESTVLSKAIAEALAQFPNLDVAAEQAICDDPTKNATEVKKAEESLNEKLLAAQAAAAVESSTPDHPTDMTSFITNPSFEDGNYNGWSVKSSNDTGAKENSNGTYHCDNADGNYLFNIWAWGYPITQEVKSLPTGIYQVSTMVSSSNDCPLIYMLAGDSHKAIPLETNPSDGLKQTWLTTGNMIVRVDSTLKIGVVGCAADGYTYTENGKWWYKTDNFQLKYYGGKDESYVYWRDNGDDMITLYNTDTLMTTSILETYNGLLEAFKEATTKETILDAYDKVAAYDSVVSANVTAWAEYQAAIAAANDVAADKTIKETSYKDDLSDYLLLDAGDNISNHTLTDEEIYEEIAKLEKLKNDAIKYGVTDGSDMTKYLANPKFDNGTSGWNGAPTINQKCAEKYGCNSFDVWQEIKDAPVGMYEISMQGFYRQSRDDAASKDTASTSFAAGAAWSLFFDTDGNPKSPAPDTLAFVYLNSNKTPIKCLYEEQIKVGEVMTSGTARIDPYKKYWYADDMTSAALAFADKDSTGKARYSVSAYGLVAKEGDAMRIGVKGDLLGGANWAIFDNFTLTYREYNAKLIKSEFDAAVSGYSVPTIAMGDSIRKAANALADSIANVDINDGEAMFHLLSQVYEMKESMEASIAVFKTLTARLEEFSTQIEDYGQTASAEATAEAMELLRKYSDINSGLNDEDVPGVIAELDAAAQKLRIPGDYASATDDNEVDFTSVIDSYTFTDKDGANTVAGWTYTSVPGGITSGQTAAGAAEYYEKTFNIYQDLSNLPAGTYQVAVNACYRYGSSTQDFDSIDVPSLAVMYAVTSTDSIVMPVCHMADFAQTEKVGTGSEATVTNNDGETFYIPNDMLSSVAYFNLGCYNNKINVKVPEDGKLRIGMTQKKSISGGWFLMDDWSLTYFGKNSTKEQGGVTAIESLEETAPKAIEFYNINGIKMSGLHQGINIVRRTNANGNMKTIKVIVR